MKRTKKANANKGKPFVLEIMQHLLNRLITNYSNWIIIITNILQYS